MYRVIFTDKAIKTLRKFDKSVSRTILAWIRKNLDRCENPRRIGKPLTANHAERWRYRVGDYRIMAEIDDKKIIIFIVNVGHRKDIYR